MEGEIPGDGAQHVLRAVHAIGRGGDVHQEVSIGREEGVASGKVDTSFVTEKNGLLFGKVFEGFPDQSRNAL